MFTVVRDNSPPMKPARNPRRAYDEHGREIEPMTLGNMRQNGVRRLSVSCWICHHAAVIDVGDYPDPVPVPTFGPRMVELGDRKSAPYRRAQ